MAIITIQDVRDAKPDMIYYGALSCWWTHDPNHLCRLPNGKGGHTLPCDPRGGVLMQTDDVEGFLKAAENNPGHYGRHGIKAFEAAHHLNCIVSEKDKRSTCMRSWEEYNIMLDKEI